ncbi:neugrin isoform 1-T3 [Synchiropus picturatus]
MTRPLRLLSLLPGLLAARTVTPRVSAVSCRYMSRRNNQHFLERSRAPSGITTLDNGDSFEEPDFEDVEDKLQALFLEEKRKSKKLKFNILKRKMTPPGPPDRKLTWQSIEQIRYLKQEHPEEWTVERLAEGFSVSTDAILRVLRSKFIPPLERKAKQDTKVMQRYGQSVLTGAVPSRLKLPAAPSAAALTVGHRTSDLVPVSDRHLMVTGQSSAPVPVQVNHVTSELTSASLTVDGAEELLAEGSTESEEDWDGLVLSEQELEELVDREMPAPPMLQVGNDVFDAEGNFLFRI